MSYKLRHKNNELRVKTQKQRVTSYKLQFYFTSWKFISGNATWWALKFPVAPPNLAVWGSCLSKESWFFILSIKTVISFPILVGDARK